MPLPRMKTELSPGERGGMFGAATSIEAGAAAIELRQALDEQARELDAVLARFMHARKLMPQNPPLEWRGPARLFYGWALDRLGSELATAEETLRSAIRETRRAAESLSDRVG